jgi:hypothetical protein
MAGKDMLNDTKDFQQTLHEVLNVRLNSKSNQEIVLQKILSKPEKTITSDFQEMLKRNVKPLTEDKVKKDLKPKVTEKSKDISRQVKTVADVNKIASDLEKEKEEDKNGHSKGEENSSKALTAREEALKHMYLAALEEYYTLREDLYKRQIKDNDIALDDKNYLKLLQYENFMRKCDTLFKASTGSYISSQDEEISKKENKYAYDAAKSEKKIVNEHEHSINEIDMLNDEIENKANEIIEFNEAAKHNDIPNYEQKLDSLENEYISLNAKMHMLKPNILELYRQEEDKELQDKTTERTVGTMYKKNKQKQVLEKDVVRLDRTVEKRDDSLDDAAKREKDELKRTNIKLAESHIDSAEDALKKEDVGKATELVNRAKELVGDEGVDNITSENKSEFSKMLQDTVSLEDEEEIKHNTISQTDKIDEHLKNAINDTELSNVQRQCIEATYTPEERDKNVLAREAEKEKEEEELEITAEVVEDEDLKK